MPAVETRKGILKTLLKCHAWCSFITFILVLFVFKWLMMFSVGPVVIFTISTAVLMVSSVYSYSYSQSKIDKRDKGGYDWLMPLKIGVVESLIIIVPAVFHIILVNAVPPAGELFGILARLWNYSFFYYFYGTDGWYYNYLAMGIITLIPVAVAYIGYWLGIKGFIFSGKLNKAIYKK